MLKLLSRSMLVLLMCVSFVSITACSTAPKSDEGKADIEKAAEQKVSEAQTNDPSMKKVLSDAAGYAVFPNVGKGAVGIGAAYGKGVLFAGGKAIGYCDLSQASIGLALGGQSYTEIIAFQTKEALTKFQSGNFAFGAQATAVALKTGAGANAKYSEGVAVFTFGEAGLMYEASVGGQKFAYQPK
jgi:lipid-binding SYLF domain-containing protein